jgi:Tfp pilus assembly protein PilO
MKLPELERLGAPGVVGLGLLVLALSFYVGTVAPTLEELATQHAEQERLRAALASTAAAAIAGGPGQMASGRLPGLTAAPELLKQLHQLASTHGAAIDRIGCQLKNRNGLLRLEVTMPLTLPYVALRAYLRDAMKLAPAASLDGLSLQRRTATDASVEAQVRISYGFAVSP